MICGQGPAPAGATIAHYRGLGLDLIPGTGLLPACVPGTFDAYMLMLRDYGTMRLRDVLEPAIGYWLNGHPIVERASRHHRHRGRAVPRALADLGRRLPARRQGAEARLAVPQRRRRRHLRAHPQGGRGRRRRPRGRDRARAQGLEPGLRRRGDRPLLPHAGGDGRLGPAQQGRAARRRHGEVAGRPSRRRSPTTTAATRVCKAGPWTQGPVLLQQLALLEGLRPRRLDPTSADFIHLVVEASKLAYRRPRGLLRRSRSSSTCRWRRCCRTPTTPTAAS